MLLLPWVVAGTALAYLFNKIPPAQMIQGFRYMAVIPFIAFSIFIYITLILTNTWGLSKVISQFSFPIRTLQLLPARCISSVLIFVDYNAAQAGMAYYLKKVHGARFRKTYGAIIFVTAVDLYLVIFLAMLGSLLMEPHEQEIHIQRLVQRVTLIALVALLFHWAFWHRWFDRLLPANTQFSFGNWIRRRRIFQAFHEASIADYVRITFLRLPVHLIAIFSFWIFIYIFGAKISWRAILANLPLIGLVRAMPISPGGLGTADLATVELLKDNISLPEAAMGVIQPQDLLLTISLTLFATGVLIRTMAGLFFWYRRPKEPPPTDPVENDRPMEIENI